MNLPNISSIETNAFDKIINYLNTPISLGDWEIWLLGLVFVFFILWLFFGGGDYEYIGLAPLKIGVDSTKYTNPSLYNLVDQSNRNANNYHDRDNDNDSKKTQPSKKRVSKGEQICRDVIEKIFNKPFPTVRPNFLKNPETNRNLELDCYNSDLKIAIEYNGIQHYKWPNFTNQTKESFIKQVRRDQYKIKTCDENGVYLITVPYTVPHDKIEEYIWENLPDTVLLNSCDNILSQNDICIIDDF